MFHFYSTLTQIEAILLAGLLWVTMQAALMRMWGFLVSGIMLFLTGVFLYFFRANGARKYWLLAVTAFWLMKATLEFMRDPISCLIGFYAIMLGIGLSVLTRMKNEGRLGSRR